jgi:hypothetical protein
VGRVLPDVEEECNRFGRHGICFIAGVARTFLLTFWLLAMSCAVCEYEARERSMSDCPDAFRVEALARVAEPIRGNQADYDSLVELIADNN